MQGKKILFLFLALLLPICVFVFLKIFGKNEFAVPPLFQDTLPEIQAGCPPVKLPYTISNEMLPQTVLSGDSLGLIYYPTVKPSRESQNQITRFKKEFKQDPITLQIPDSTSTMYQSRYCVFFLKEPYDLVLIDQHGVIRGQYVSEDREEVDRLITEIDIILKKY